MEGVTRRGGAAAEPGSSGELMARGAGAGDPKENGCLD
jgi:hypothetical protein